MVGLSRNRFLGILKFLRLADVDTYATSNDRLRYIQPFISMLNNRYQNIFCPRDKLSVD